MTATPKCFDLIKDIDNITPLVLQYFKSNLNTPFNDMLTCKYIMSNNGWGDGNIDISQNMFDAIPSTPIDCSSIINIYNDANIKNCCLVCNMSNIYKNANQSEEEAIVSYLLNNLDFARSLIEADFDSTFIKSQMLYTDDGHAYTEPILRIICEALLKNSSLAIDVTELFSNINEKHNFIPGLAGNVIRYITALSDSKISKERIRESILRVAGDRYETIIFNEDATNDIISILECESDNAPSLDKDYSVPLDDAVGPNQLTYLEQNQQQCKQKRRTNNIDIAYKNDKKKNGRGKASTNNRIENQLTIDSYKEFNSEVSISLLDNDHAAYCSVDTKNVTPVEISASRINIQSVNNIDTPEFIIEPIKSLKDYLKIQTNLLTAGSLYLHYFLDTDNILVFYDILDKPYAFIIDLSVKEIVSEISLLLISPSIKKILPSLMNLGDKFNMSLFKGRSIYDLNCMKLILEGNRIVSNRINDIMNLYTIDSFEKTSTSTYIDSAVKGLSNFDDYYKELANNKLLDIYETHLSLMKLLANSVHTLNEKNYLRKTVTGKFIIENEVEYNTNTIPLYINTSNIPPLSLLIEYTLLQIVKSKVPQLTNIKLFALTNNSISIDCEEAYVSILFDVLNQYMIHVYKTYITLSSTPKVLISLN